MRKQLLTLLGAGLIGLMHLAAAQADPLDFTFSFSNVFGNISGTVTGEIFGLTVGNTHATNVIVDNYPAGIEPPSPPQTIFTDISLNLFFVDSSDQVTHQDFVATNADATLLLQLQTERNALENQGTGNITGNAAGLFGIIYTLVTPVPEPSSVTLLGIGLGVAALWQLRRRRQREGAAA